MGRKRRDWLNMAHNRLVDWANWHLLHMRSNCLTYPSQSWPDAIGSQGQASAAVPDVMAPTSINEVYKAVKSMPPALRDTVVRLYLNGLEVSKRAHEDSLLYTAAKLRE